MMGGKHQDGQAGNGSHVLPPRDDRETLSALLDGELPGDAARFAIKRLSHDVQWRETCGRWQLIGDAMRGEAVALAPHDFAAGVARALEYTQTEVEPAASSTMGPARALPRGRWIGGAALAASLAVAAVLVVKPFTSAPTTAQPVPTLAETAAPPEAAAPAPANAIRPAEALLAGGGESAAGPATPAPVVAAASAHAPTRSSSSATRAASRATRAPEPETVLAAAAPAATATSGPFQPPAHEVASRPWPRAVLPGASSAGALTVGFGESSNVPSQAFYPFEPQPVASEGQVDEDSSP